jgi:hypothetical protein
MGLEVPLGDEFLEAFMALKGSLPCVSSHVCFEITSLSELLQTRFKWAKQNLFLVFWSLYFFELA